MKRKIDGPGRRGGGGERERKEGKEKESWRKGSVLDEKSR